MKDLIQKALDYHSRHPAGKLQILPTKPLDTQDDLSLAYTPGVAEPVKKIFDNNDDAYVYTNKANLVGIISNGSSTLGLGNQGAYACKPVMEGKSVLFKSFANVDAYDIELDTEDSQKIIDATTCMAPTFGAICLEDIKAPECFEIEEALRKQLSIPVFHDDQHGTAIVVLAGLMNALELVSKSFEDTKFVFNGAGAAAVAIAKLCTSYGVKKENIVMCDSKGVIYSGREEGMSDYKKDWASDTTLRSLEEALVDADVFIGVSRADCVTPAMLKTMAESPVIFALANPNPEIPYDLAKSTRDDAVIATGRSDYPNQVNNVLGFPFIFRGALDVRATDINDSMKIAAAKALAALAKEAAPESVATAYEGASLVFGKDYILPKPLDHRVCERVAPAVAEAAMLSGVARISIDIEQYRDSLRN